MSSGGGTPFWNMNIPVHLHTKQCPEFLTYAFANAKDRGILSTPDSEYRRQTWQDVQRFIRQNRLELFERLPSDLRRYREYCAKLIAQYGTVMQFVMKERLKWTTLEAKEEPFAHPDDYKILYNDWPYGIDARVVHLVVWTRFDLQTTPITPEAPTGDLTPQARGQINGFVDRIFVSFCGQENVIWFKNWSSLQSINAIQHFHVMLFDPDMDFVRHITGGDMPLSEQVKEVA